MILLIDNYDSFSYNLYQFLGTINPDIKVIRNDGLTVKEILDLKASHIVISPGPGTPSDAGVIEDLIRNIDDTPLLGICLGHQAICEVFGADIVHAPKIMHGKRDLITINNKTDIFEGLPEQIEAARYHSLIAKNVPNCLEVIAQDKDGEVMAVKHKAKRIYGLQFHPESIMTPKGMQILKNYLRG